MPCLRTLLRIFAWTVLSLVTLCLLLVVAFKIQRYVLRHRAEALMADIQSIKLRQTTFEDVQPILRRWQKWESFHGACTAERCTSFIELSDLNSPWNTFLYHHSRIFTLVSRIGDRPASIRAVIGVVDGLVWREGFAMRIETQVWEPDGASHTHLIGGSEISTSKPQWVSLGSQWHLHPEYAIWWAANMPDDLQFDFTPFADPSQIRPLMFMDFSCLTRWMPCQAKRDLMPAAVARTEYWNSLPYDDDVWKEQCTDPIAIEMFGRDSANILLVEVVSNEAFSQKFGEYVHRMRRIRFRLLDSMKLRGSQSAPSALTFVFFDDPNSTPPSPIALRPGGRMIFFFGDTIDQVHLAGCSPLPPTAANLAAVRRGIAKDTRPPGLPEFAFGD